MFLIQRDVFLAGLNFSPVTTSILQISDDLSFDEAATRAKAFTQLRQDASMLHNPVHHADTFDNAHRMQSLPQSCVCVCCSQRATHKAENCFALKLKYNSCSKLGNLARVCKSSKTNQRNFTDARQHVRFSSEDPDSHCDATLQYDTPASCHIIKRNSTNEAAVLQPPLNMP